MYVKILSRLPSLCLQQFTPPRLGPGFPYTLDQHLMFHVASLRLGLTVPRPSRRHHAQSLLGPSFYDPRTPHILESHPERAAPLSCRDEERRHAVGSHYILALRLYLAACNPS